MKLSQTAVLASLLLASADAFGTTTRRGQIAMRVGRSDLTRRQRFNNILSVVEENPSKATVESTLVTADTSTLIEKCNWKIRKSLIRKVNDMAAEYGVDVDDGFGVPPTTAEREAAQQAAKVTNTAARLAKQADDVVAAKAAQEKRAQNKAARVAAAADARAKALASKPAAPAPAPVPAPEPVAAAPEPEAVVEAAPEPEPVEAAPEPAAAAPAPAAATGGEVTPKTIKALRDLTGAGMMDCKKALLECDGDQETAAENLRKKGLAKADKKASRIAAEGKIASASEGSKAVLVEVNCETDFVAKDSSFLDFTSSVATSALNMGSDDLDGLLASDIGGTTVEETRQALVSKIGENIQVRRMESRGSDGSTVGAYVHMNRIGVLVELEGGSSELASDIAMHVAAMNPPFAVPEQVPGDVLEKERSILSAQALESGKPPEIVEKMVEGRIRKYLEEICLVSQTYVKTNDKTVGKLLEENGAKMVGFTRIEVGEGIEKKVDDFAAEVASMAAGNV